jgi:LysR family transcriptional regulator for metE and metH
VILEVRHLRLVEAIAREGSVTGAGARLHLSQSALSHQLRELEDRLGAPLFHRLRKRMLPTQAGERILSLAPAILEQLEQVEHDIGGLGGDRDGILRITTEWYTTYSWLAPRLAAFTRRFPRVEVRVMADGMAHPLEALAEGRLDLAIVCSICPSLKLAYHSLFRDEMLVVMEAGHPLADRAFVEPQDFAPETLIGCSSASDCFVCREVLVPAGVHPRRVWQVQLTEAVIDLVRCGLGISVMSRWAARRYLKPGEVVARRLTRQGLFREWSAATLGTQTALPHVAELIALLREPPLQAWAGEGPVPSEDSGGGPDQTRAGRPPARMEASSG